MVDEAIAVHTMSTTTAAPINNSRIIHVAVGSKNPCKIKAVRSAFEETFSLSSSSSSTSSPPQRCQDVTIVISCHDVSSGVRDQPFGDDETRQGAKNRAQAAYNAALQQSFKTITNVDGTDGERLPPPDFAVGLEGGVESSNFGVGFNIRDDDDETTAQRSLWCMAWMAILSTTTHNRLSNNNRLPDTSTSSSCESSSYTTPSTAMLSKEISPSTTTTNNNWGFSKTASFALPHSITKLVLEEGMELGHADDKVFGRVDSKSRDGTVGFLTEGRIGRSEYYVHALELALVPLLWPEHYGGGGEELDV